MVGEHLRVAGGLRGQQGAEGEVAAGDGEVLGGLARDLDVDPGGRAALVELAGGVQEPGAPAEGDRPLGADREGTADVLEPGERDPVQVGHHRDVPGVPVELPEQRLDRRAQVGGAVQPVAAQGAHLDGTVGEVRGRGLRGALQHGAGRDLRALHVGLVVGVDAEDPAGHRGGHLPEQQLGAERAGDRHVGAAGLRGLLVVHVGVGDEPGHGDVVRGQRHLGRAGVGDHDRQDPGALLAGALRDQLLGPVGEAVQPGALVDDHELVPQRLGGRHRRAEAQPGVALVVVGEQVGDGVGLVEQPVDVGAGETAGDQAEGGERGVAAADRRVGVHHPVAAVAGLPVERAAGVGDDHDVPGRVEPGVAERLLERAPLGVGLDRRPGLAGDHDHGARDPVLERGADLVGVGGVDDGELDAVGGADDLGGQRGAAHAAQRDVGDPLVLELAAQGGDLTEERAGGPVQAHPAEPLAGLVLGLGTPQGGVLGEQPAGEPLGDERGHGPAHRVGSGARGGDLERVAHLAAPPGSCARSRRARPTTSRTSPRPPPRGWRSRRRSRCRPRRAGP